MHVIQPGLFAPGTGASLDAALCSFRDSLGEAIRGAFALKPEQVATTITLAGGSSLMRLVGEETRRVCTAASVR